MYEEERIFTVTKEREDKSRIILRGDWLKDLGFSSGKKVSVKIIKENDVNILDVSVID